VRLPRSSPRDPLRGRAVASGLDSLMAPSLFRATSIVRSSASIRPSWGSSRVALRAPTTLPRCSARLKIECGRPCEVDVPPPSGPGRRHESRAVGRASPSPTIQMTSG
jgi:hypothetical protein